MLAPQDQLRLFSGLLLVFACFEQSFEVSILKQDRLTQHLVVLPFVVFARLLNHTAHQVFQVWQSGSLQAWNVLDSLEQFGSHFFDNLRGWR